MRTYYDNRGRRIGHSASLKEELFWSSTVGMMLLFAAFVLAIPIYFFPRAVMRSTLTPPAKMLVIAAGWAALVIFGMIVPNH